jgi:beta-lactamase class A
MRPIFFQPFILSSFFVLLFSCTNNSQDKSSAAKTPDGSAVQPNPQDTAALKKQLQEIASGFDGEIGVAVLDLQNGTMVTLNEGKHFPMQSVFKFPLAIAVMDQVDKGKLSLDQKITLTKKDLLQDTYSPLRDKYEGQNASVSIKEILGYTVSHSDNNGCDMLFRLLGGPQQVNNYIHSIGIKDISIVATEEEMHKEWNVQFTNWCTPVAMTSLLKTFYQGNVLSKASHDTLLKIMEETTTGAKRIKALLPEGTVFAHKTGTSDTKDGVTAAINDVGIVTLPDGRHFAITVFASNSKATTENIEAVVAKVGKAAWDSFLIN